MDVVCAVCLVLTLSAWFASAERHSVYWNSSNPHFLWDEYSVEVRINDYLDIICPHYAPHAPEKFSEKFQRFTPFTLGKEFQQGESYYYISKPMHHHGQDCLRLRVNVVQHKSSAKIQTDKFKAEETEKSLDGEKVKFSAAGGVHNLSNRLPADDPSAMQPNVQRSIGSSGEQLVSLSVFFTTIQVLLALTLL
ncbi:ephrin-A1b isoform X2 [Gouania willdenowi]|uniref:ephrin-A1b isoform X2 n=1 Tax=Gouania willdenowi TaxID=441366 RepID=UPI0010542095|nr:ephrin-A1 isoform X2 [Gouania willdenowi]